jgi:hypothetical protein
MMFDFGYLPSSAALPEEFSAFFMALIPHVHKSVTMAVLNRYSL